MAFGRSDVEVQDALGPALSGAQVYWCTQPASTTENPPSPLATIYTDSSGGTTIDQPVLTDGFGYAYAYLDDSQPYTIVIWHPLFGENPIVRPDQTVNGAGETSGLTPFAGVPLGTIDGVNTVFTLVNGSTPLTVLPSQIVAWLNFPLVEGVGFSVALSGGVAKITYATAPQPVSGGNPADVIYAQGLML